MADKPKVEQTPEQQAAARKALERKMTRGRFNLLNVPRTKVKLGLQGKAILIYGASDSGKTLQTSKASKPLYVGFEAGAGAINDMPHYLMNSWAEYKQLNALLTSTMTSKEAREQFDTIIIDQAGAMARMCRDHVAIANNVAYVEDDWTLWNKYDMEFWREVDALLKCGYSVIFIAHEDYSKDEDRWVPRGCKRAMELIRTSCDLVARLTSNGFYEDGTAVWSSAYFKTTKEHFARSRYEKIVPYIETFTLENLEEALNDAIRLEAEEKGYEVEESVQMGREEYGLDLETAKAEIGRLGKELAAIGLAADATSIVHEHLGIEGSVHRATQRQRGVLNTVLTEFEVLHRANEDKIKAWKEQLAEEGSDLETEGVE